MRANNYLCQENESGMFCTLFYGILNTETGEVKYANAGHTAPYLMNSDGKSESIPITGDMALGVMEDISFQTSTLSMNKKSSIYLFTDGINEAMNEDQEEYSLDRLESFLDRKKSRSVSDIVDDSLKNVKLFVGTAPQSDDITVLVIKYLG